MTQNVYDDAAFFAAYSQLPRSVHGLDAAPEWPALRALLPNMRGLRVLDLGCGYGWFCRWARESGAAHVLGVDVSERMLARARELTEDAAIAYRHVDLERLTLPANSFDLVYSSLALHYIGDLDRLLSGVHRWLVTEAPLVFSAEHPIFTAPSLAEWSIDGCGRRTWPLDRYLEEGPRSRDWLMNGVVKHHRTLGTYVNLLLRLGFALTHLEEWGPTDTQIAQQPELAAERQRPMFVLLAARK